MVKKRFFNLFSFVILLIMISSPILSVSAAATSEVLPLTEPIEDASEKQLLIPDDGTQRGLPDGRFTFIEPPYLSEDGTALFNANLPRVLVVDTNPEMQNLRFPQDPETSAAIAGARSPGATFDITYIPAGSSDAFGNSCVNYPENAKTAFNAATAIWASNIQSSVPITISTCWTFALPSVVLGMNGVPVWSRDFPGAPLPNTWYQAALANSIAGYDLAPVDYDMVISYNASFNWYYGTDGNTPAGQVDLVTVAAHEIAHGLNFAGLMEYDGGWGRFGWGTGYPSIYETFMESGAGTKLTSYTNDSIALGTLVTSNNLWWNGTHSYGANGGSRVKMYAPASWSYGSSYSHLDYTTFAGTINSLMVYMLGSGSSQHNPGPVTMGILRDMGWQEPPQGPHQLTVNKTGSGTGTVTSVPAGIDCGATCSASFAHETTVTLSASPISESYFAGWSGSGCSGTGTCQVTMTQARTVSASFRIPGETMNVYLPLIISGAMSAPGSPLRNGDFEAGRDGSWTEYSSHSWDLIMHQSNAPVSAQGGSWLAWLGGENDETSRLSQTVTIPAAQPYLHFWYYFNSSDVCGYDFAYVKVNGTPIAEADLCNATNSSNWKTTSGNFSAYAGTTVILMFEVITDSSLVSSFYLDTVSFSSSASTAGMERSPDFYWDEQLWGEMP